MPNPLHKIIGDLLKNRISLQPTPKEYQLISNRVQFYHIVISNHFLYYLNLPDAGKLRFLKRVHYFSECKQFYFEDMEAKPEMPVPVSAAAVQLTFGLRNYKLPFFNNIYLRPDAYSMKNMKGLYVGHVSPAGIYISRKHFPEGFNNDKDGVNTALHEMAHALRHQNRKKEFGVDMEFHTDLRNI